jgi:hypothetical protein
LNFKYKSPEDFVHIQSFPSASSFITIPLSIPAGISKSISFLSNTLLAQLHVLHILSKLSHVPEQASQAQVCCTVPKIL